MVFFCSCENYLCNFLFSLITGLEAQVQDTTSKDLYWFWAFLFVDNQTTTLVNENGKRFVYEISEDDVKNERKICNISMCFFVIYYEEWGENGRWWGKVVKI